jgi:dihydrofolate synthase / folylpolyglutamate synthase
MMTAIAFEHFARENVELAVLEVGMGGRLDATNVVEPRVSVIADIRSIIRNFSGIRWARLRGRKLGLFVQAARW